MSDDNVSLTLSRDEALVLFELLAEYDREPELKLPNHPERIARVRLCGAFEKTLVEPFRPDYLDLLNAARSRLVKRYGTSE